MSAQVQKHKATAEQITEAQKQTEADLEVAQRSEETQALLDDDILADIDSVLEENGETMALAFVQQGGE